MAPPRPEAALVRQAASAPSSTVGVAYGGAASQAAKRLALPDRWTLLWAAVFLLQEVCLPATGTGEHSVRTQAPFALLASPGRILAALAVAIAVIALQGFSATTNLLISLIVLLMPFVLLGTQRTGIDIRMFCSSVAAMLLAACVVQVLVPSVANVLFMYFVDGYGRFEGLGGRASAFSMEPSFAAEVIFAITMVHLFFARKLLCWTSLMLAVSLLLVRAGTTMQQAVLLGASFGFLAICNLVCGTPSGWHRLTLGKTLAAMIFSLATLLFGYSLWEYQSFNFSYIFDSLEKFGSWRTLSNYAAYLGTDALAFFPHADGASSWADTIAAGLALAGYSDQSWIVQPFSPIGVALLDLGVFGTVIWIVLLAWSAARRFAHPIGTWRSAILVTLMTNAIFFTPKWQLSGFLAIGLIASALQENSPPRRKSP